MPIRLICICGRFMSLADKHAGRRVQCPDCSATLRIPDADEDVSLIRWFCTCGQRLKARARTGGRKIECPRCATPMTVPPFDPVDAAVSDDFHLDGVSNIVRVKNSDDAPNPIQSPELPLRSAEVLELEPEFEDAEDAELPKPESPPVADNASVEPDIEIVEADDGEIVYDLKVPKKKPAADTPDD